MHVSAFVYGRPQNREKSKDRSSNIEVTDLGPGGNTGMLSNQSYFVVSKKSSFNTIPHM